MNFKKIDAALCAAGYERTDYAPIEGTNRYYVSYWSPVCNSSYIANFEFVVVKGKITKAWLDSDNYPLELVEDKIPQPGRIFRGAVIWRA